MHRFTNRLINETSPYLLQHAHNPVDWFPWGEEALALAQKENKPVLVSIGYSACHWCHVMERESFENGETAKLMNEQFINIKIDREERPDLDHIYMDAVQAMTGSGGWPLNVFLTPEGKPFYGGTYFPPQRAYNRASWTEILIGVSRAFAEKRHEIDTQAENLTEHLIQSNEFGFKRAGAEELFTADKISNAFDNIMKSADRESGGFGQAPKFPQSFIIRFLLRYSHVSANDTALEQALLSLDKMANGGIYDQAGGGFARYSTDAEWLAPHFEKMLYDNALLTLVYSEAYQLTGNEHYKKVVEETIAFLQRELLHPGGGFYAALDADSEGEEGKFYVWPYEEVKKILGDEAEIFSRFFDISAKGNWEGKNILRVKKTKEQFSAEENISLSRLEKIIQNGKEKLLAEREKRTRPQLDDKIILSWNALMNSAISKAFEATGDVNYRQLAIQNMQFLLDNFCDKSTGNFYHTWKNGIEKHPAFLDDYAYLVQALIQLQEITMDAGYLDRAKEITEQVLKNFTEEKSGFFFYTHKDQKDIIVRKKEVYDGAQPSGNAVMADNLHRLSIYFGLPDWKNMAMQMINTIGNTVVKYPSSFGVWLGLLLELTEGTNEIALISRDPQRLVKELLAGYIPHRVIMGSLGQSSLYPLLSDKKATGADNLYLCRNYACLKPVSTAEQLLALIRAK